MEKHLQKTKINKHEKAHAFSLNLDVFVSLYPADIHKGILYKFKGIQRKESKMKFEFEVEALFVDSVFGFVDGVFGFVD